MTAGPGPGARPRLPWRGYCAQGLMVLLMNVPTISFGMALGWVSLASGEAGSGGGGSGSGTVGADAGDTDSDSDTQVVAAAATTFVAALLGVPLAARLLAAGRKVAVLATSAALLTCWSLKLVGGGWWVVAARAAAGLGGAGAWCVAPLLATEMCSAEVAGAAVAALVLSHNLGLLLMYLVADARLPLRSVLWCCVGVSALHFAAFLLVPESPSYLAAHGKHEEARNTLAWLRGTHAADPALGEELQSLPAPDEAEQAPIALAREMLRCGRRRRAFVLALVAVVGQEACGVLALLQFAERVFILARPGPDPALPMPLVALPATNDLYHVTTTPYNMTSATSNLSSDPFFAALINSSSSLVPTISSVSLASAGSVLASPARHAVILGAVQLVASGFSLYLVERVGRRPLLVATAFTTGGCLALAAGAAWALQWGGALALALGERGAAAAAALAVAALAGAVAADSAGMQPAPYAMLADMFHYRYRGCALLLATAAACVGNLAEVVVFPAVAAAAGGGGGGGGLPAALALAAALTLAYAAFAARCLPETRCRTPEEIYSELCPGPAPAPGPVSPHSEAKEPVPVPLPVIECIVQTVECKKTESTKM